MREPFLIRSFVLQSQSSKAPIDIVRTTRCKLSSITRLIAFLVLFPAIAAARPQAETRHKGDVPRFLVVGDGLYRGGQPSAAGFQMLKDKGIKTVINLRAEDNSEAKVVEKLGMHYIQIPVDEVVPWSQIPPAAIAKYFEIVNNPANYPIFFHCKRGADRTGAMAALYRVAVQGWDKKKAYDEARGIGMRWYFTGLKAQIMEFHPPSRPADLQTAIKEQ
jgi:protein tyrosine/serine phosphatase